MLVKSTPVHKRAGPAVQIYYSKTVRAFFNFGVAAGHDRVIQLYIDVRTAPENQSVRQRYTLNYAFAKNDGSRDPERFGGVWIGSNALSKTQGDWAQYNLISEFERSFLVDSDTIDDRAALAAQVLNRP